MPAWAGTVLGVMACPPMCWKMVTPLSSKVEYLIYRTAAPASVMLETSSSVCAEPLL